MSLQTVASLLLFFSWWLWAILTSALIQSCSACILTDCWTCSFVVIICCITTQASLKKHIPNWAGSHKESKGHSKGPQLIDPPHPAWALPHPAQAPHTLLYLNFFLTACRGEGLFKSLITGCERKVSPFWGSGASTETENTKRKRKDLMTPKQSMHFVLCQREKIDGTE